ncbi:MAG: putative RNA-binding Zn-ribbon protein involved in translation (DUF1610 family) [Phycisphaerales bacterium]|jgi:predicted RNA-binding Zn-ribbon protein involved in translation (DUF1610 family)
MPAVTDHSPSFLCPACGYDLAPPEGIDDLTCPECGVAQSEGSAGRGVADAESEVAEGLG